MNLSQTTIIRGLKSLKMKLYKMTTVQEILPLEYEKRMNYCHWLLQKTREYKINFFYNVPGVAVNNS